MISCQSADVIGGFCSVQDSEILPEICNEFILTYCEEIKKQAKLLPKRQKMMRMTERMCNWLYNEGLTARRLLKQSSDK